MNEYMRECILMEKNEVEGAAKAKTWECSQHLGK